MTPNALLTVDNHGTTFKIQTAHVKFSPYRCFRFCDEAFKSKAFEAIGKRLLAVDRIALAGDSDFAQRLLQAVPGLEAKVGAFITKGKSSSPAGSIPVVSAENLPAGIKTVFLCETRTFEREKLAESMPAGVEVLDAWMLPDLMACQEIPHHCWVYLPKSIYPLQVPPIEFRPNLDMLLIDCPARNLALMPNGLGYVHNTLKKTGLDFQTFDVDITIYHRFHIHRIFDWGGRVILDNGRELPIDPWQAEHYDVWTDPAVIDYFKVHIRDLVAAITHCKPKILGMSVHGCNIEFSREVMKQVKAALPETQILVGGFSCYNADIGRKDLPECDYMCIAESDLTVGPLVERLAMGERPFNQAGVLSRYDTPDYKYLPAPLPHNLDFIEFPKYEWFDLSLYRNYNGYQLTPIIASRGCRWSRCTFCAERFYWRIRSTEDFMKELRWLVSRGCDLFMFNESDLNGMPDKVLEICDAIIASGLKVKLTGQLRINKDSDLAFFSKLRRAGFVALRFGVDAFSENTLRLQKKGYRKETATQNLRDCKRAGIYTEINWVIGVPGETEEDVDEGIAFCIANMPYIGRIANINPLMVVQGSVYWIEPDAHNIKFRGDREELFRTHPRAMPAHLWYSTEPYIDADVRTRWFNKIVRALHSAGFDMGSWAKRVVDDVESGRDANRTSGTKAAEAQKEPAAVRDAAKQESPPPQVPDQATESLKAKPAQKGMEFIYRVDSAGQAEPEPEKPEERMRVLKHRDRFFMVDPEQVHAERIKQPFLLSFFKSKQSPILAVLKSKDLKVLNARLTDVEPRILQALGSYKILELDGQYFSLPQSTRLRDVRWADEDLEQTPGLLCAGSLREIIDLTRLHLQARGETVDATSIDSADARVDMSALLSTGLAAATLKDPEPPQLVDNVRNYNIVFHRGCYIGIPRELGAMDLEKQDPRGKPGVLVDECLANLERRIVDPNGISMPELRLSLDVPVESKGGGSGNGHHHDHDHERDQAPAHAHAAEAEEPPADPHGPPLLLRQIGQFNIVRYKGVYYGVPQSVGPVDLTVQDVKLLPGVVHSDSLVGAESEIRKVIEAERSGTGPAPKHASPPQLIEVIKDYNVVYYAGTYYALNQRLGSVDLQKQDVKGMAGVVHDASHPGLLVKLEEFVGPLETATPKQTHRPEARATKPATPTQSKGKSNSTPLPASNRSSGAAQMSGSKHPVFIKTLEHYNILQYAGYYYALPQQMGEVDLEVIDAMTLPGMIYDVSLAALENEVNDACAKERAKMS